jgi:hypothetical protein
MLFKGSIVNESGTPHDCRNSPRFKLPFRSSPAYHDPEYACHQHHNGYCEAEHKVSLDCHPSSPCLVGTHLKSHLFSDAREVKEVNVLLSNPCQKCWKGKVRIQRMESEAVANVEAVVCIVPQGRSAASPVVAFSASEGLLMPSSMDHCTGTRQSIVDDSLCWADG